MNNEISKKSFIVVNLRSITDEEKLHKGADIHNETQLTSTCWHKHVVERKQ